MSVRAKFKCISVEGNPEWKSVKLEAIINGSEENKSFFRMTPSGRIAIECINPEANKIFEPGKEYFVDFTVANDAPAPISTVPKSSPETPAETKELKSNPEKEPVETIDSSLPEKDILRPAVPVSMIPKAI